jgi:K+-transporting ATPase KdpC subunit
MFLKSVRTAFLSILLFTVLTGLMYPLIVTALAQLFFPGEANESIITSNGKPVGSALIGQAFNSPGYFWSRPSATSPFAYNAGAFSLLLNWEEAVLSARLMLLILCQIEYICIVWRIVMT